MAGKLPIYELKVSGINDPMPAVNFVATVDQPAIEQGWMKFGEKKPIAFKTADVERRIITGPLMIADLPIYRRDEELGEHNVIFRKDTIELIVKKFAKAGYYNNVNMMHQKELIPGGIYMIESMIIDKARGVNTPSLFDKAPDGSWFASYYVENDTLWNDYIMKGIFTGFSVEGFFKTEFSTQKPVTVDEMTEWFTWLQKNI
jgi:hypothetical protein